MTDYLKGAIIFASENVRDFILARPVLSRAKINLKDGAYLGLRLDNLKAFLRDFRDIAASYRTDIFDCDDFAAVMRGQIISECYRQEFPQSILCAELCHWPADGGAYHDALLTLDADGRMWFCEPQQREGLHGIEEKVKMADEVWG